MIWVDYAILATIGLSAVMSFMRGFISEVVSLAGWVAAIWIAIHHAERAIPLLQPYIETPSLQHAAAFLLLLLLTLMAAALLNWLLQLIARNGMGGTDKLLGMLFGTLRGALMVVALVIAAGYTPIPQDPWWQQSQLLPYFQQLALELRDYLPAEIAGKLHYP